MKVTEFVNEAKRIEKMPTLYKLGTFMNKKNGKYFLCDCSGLIKAIIWGYPDGKEYYKSNGLADINANTMIKKCSDVNTDFSTIQAGECVWLSGHIGIYIGGGLVVESTPKWENGVQITALGNLGGVKGYNTRTWKKHGKMPWVEYGENTKVSNIPSLKGYKGFSLVDGLKKFGYKSDFQYRAKLWNMIGKTSKYKGSSLQNITLLNYLKSR